MNINNKFKNGLTFIEILIVVTIIGIFGTIAVPAYQDYVTKSQVVQGLNLASSAKPPVVEYYSNIGEFPNKNQDIGFVDNNSNSHTNMNIHENGEIRATFGLEVNKVAQGKTLSLYPVSIEEKAIQWDCESNLENKYLPDGCNKQADPHTEKEYKSLTCEPNQKGEIKAEREVTIPPRGSPSYSDWVVVSDTCDYYKIKDENEIRNGTCPDNQRGTLTESRTYELWSDNSKKNYGNWTVATNTCNFYKVTDETETRNGTCPANQRGTLTESRTYELWSDNSKKNYGNWNVATNTCAFYKVKDEVETRNGTCPANQRGTLTESRKYELWSDNSKKNYGNWTVATNTCAFYKVRDEYENRNLTCPTGQTGTITERRKYEVWSDNSKKNYGNWERTSNTCKAIAGWTATIELMGTVPNTPGCPPNAFLTYYRFVYKWNDGRTTYSSQKRSCGAPNTVPGGPPVYPNYIN